MKNSGISCEPRTGPHAFISTMKIIPRKEKMDGVAASAEITPPPPLWPYWNIFPTGLSALLGHMNCTVERILSIVHFLLIFYSSPPRFPGTRIYLIFPIFIEREVKAYCCSLKMLLFSFLHLSCCRMSCYEDKVILLFSPGSRNSELLCARAS